MDAREVAAQAAHEVNRAYCLFLGDDSQPPWEAAPDWQKDSALAGVDAISSGLVAQASDSHESWLVLKTREGWTYGPVKDPEKKEHPCMVPFDELPFGQQAKDHLFVETVRTVLSTLAG